MHYNIFDKYSYFVKKKYPINFHYSLRSEPTDQQRNSFQEPLSNKVMKNNSSLAFCFMGVRVVFDQGRAAKSDCSASLKIEKLQVLRKK